MLVPFRGGCALRSAALTFRASRTPVSVSPHIVAMSTAPACEKQELRKQLKADLRAFSLESQRQESEVIQKLLMESTCFKNACRVGVYVHCEKLREVGTELLLQSLLSEPSKRCYVPLIKQEKALMHMLHIESLDDLQPMTMGILEPTINYSSGQAREEVLEAKDPLDLLILPGLGFDKQCNRLGRGGGCGTVGVFVCGACVVSGNWEKVLGLKGTENVYTAG